MTFHLPHARELRLIVPAALTAILVFVIACGLILVSTKAIQQAAEDAVNHSERVMR